MAKAIWQANRPANGKSPGGSGEAREPGMFPQTLARPKEDHTQTHQVQKRNPRRHRSYPRAITRKGTVLAVKASRGWVNWPQTWNPVVRMLRIMFCNDLFGDGTAISHWCFKPHEFKYSNPMAVEGILHVFRRIGQTHHRGRDFLSSLFDGLGLNALDDLRFRIPGEANYQGEKKQDSTADDREDDTDCGTANEQTNKEIPAFHLSPALLLCSANGIHPWHRP